MLNRWLGKTTRFVTFFCAAVILVACGGGSDGVGSGGFLGNSGGNTLDAVISITATNAAGESDNELSADNPLTITVTLQRGNGDPIAEAIVDLATSVGSVSPDNGSALTDASGVAVFEVTFDGTEGAGTLTASYTEEGQTVDVDLGIQAVAIEVTPAYLIELETTDSGGNPSKRFSNVEPLTVIVTLYAVDGDELTPLVDEIISLESSIGTIDPSNGSSLTDENGQALFVLSAESDVGAGLIVAAYAAPSGDLFTRSQNVEVQLATGETPAFALDLQLLDAAGNVTTELTDEEPVTARVTLSSSLESVSIESRIITLDSTIANVSPANGSTLTDANGVAEFLLEFGGTIGAGTVTASFATDDLSLIETAVLEASSTAVENSLSILLLDPNGNVSNVLTDDSPLTVRVSITDRDGNLQDIDDEIIQLDSELGDLSPSNGQALTNNGTAEFTLQFNGSVGAGVVTATYSTEQGDLEQSANIEAQTDEASTYVLSLSRSAGSVTPTNPVTVTVNLRSGSASGPAVAGELVSLSSSVTDVSPDNGTVVTDATGNAVFILKFNGTEGAGAVEASYTSEEGNSFTNSINVTASQGTPLYELRITTPTSGASFTEAGIDVRVNLSASIAGQNRARLITLASDVGIITPDNNSALTNSSGNADFVLTGDGSTGSGFMTATFVDEDGNVYEDVVSVTMNTSGLGGGGTDPSKIEFVSATPETIALKGSGGGEGLSEQSTVIFRVSDSSDEGVAGQSVSFSLSTDLGGVALQSATGTTDANGNVVAVVNAGTVPTPVRVEATTTVPVLGQIGALSSVLNVSAGVPVANRFNLYRSADQTPCEPATDSCTMLIVYAFDRFGNPAVDGTTVNFVTNCGGVGRLDGPSTGSCVLGDSGFGRCEVQWLASDLDPLDPTQCLIVDDNGAEQSVDIQVMGYALGEESFADSDADGYFSVGDNFNDLGEPFLDELGDLDLGSEDADGYAPGDFFIDWNSSGAREANTGNKSDASSSLYNGTACVANQGANPPNPATDCSQELIFLFDSIDPLP